MGVHAYLLVACGGAIGAVLRFACSSLVGTGFVFPWATFGINIAGALGIGLVWGLWQDAAWFVDWGRMLLVVGLLGGFTTFSTFSLEMFTMLNQGRWMLAIGYSVSSVALCVLVTWLGLRAGQMVQ